MFLDDKQEGLWKLYYNNGKLNKENTFENNKIISRKCWGEDGNEIECEE